MTARFDLGEFVNAGVAAVQAYVAEHPELPALEPGASLDWPPPARARSDIARLRVRLVMVAFELVRRRFTPAEGAARFVEIALLAIAAGEHATREAAKVAGYGEASGRQRTKAHLVLRQIEQGLKEGATPEEIAQRAGISRRSYFRYRGLLTD